LCAAIFHSRNIEELSLLVKGEKQLLKVFAIIQSLFEKAQKGEEGKDAKK